MTFKNPNCKEKIGIIGATGVLGTLLINTPDFINANPFEGDITNNTQLNNWISSNQFDSIFHFAALVPVNKVENDILRAYEVNVSGTINILNAVEKFSKKTWLFFASSSHVYSSSELPIPETHSLEPHNYYGRTKMMADLICQDAIKLKKLNICIGRIFSFYHETQTEEFLYSSLKKRLKFHNSEETFELFGAKNIRDLSPADEIIKQIILLFNNKVNGPYNIGSGKGITIESFAEKIAGSVLKIKDLSDGKTNSLVANITKIKKLSN